MYRTPRGAAVLGVVIAAIAVGAAPARGASLDELRQKAGLLALREPTETIDFELEDLSGKKLKLSSFAGRVVLLNFWATWCGPCRAEIPSMQELYGKLSSLGLVVVAVNLQESKGTVAAFAKSSKMTFPILLDTQGEVGSTYGASAIPTTYVIDRRGLALAGIQGSMEWNTPAVEAYLRALLAVSP
jgi:thiol-disulfide isomerase/thioredoxin